MHRLAPYALGLTLALTSACGRSPLVHDPFDEARAALRGFGQRGGRVLADEGYGDGATRLVYLDQGWHPGETLWFYHADQGSTLMPYEMLVHLEQADRAAPLIAPEHLARFRFLNQHATPNNPDALPIGFARRGDDVGITCAACHTGQINYQGTALRIDGAPAMIDMIGFFRSISASIAATLADEAKLARYAAAVSGRGTEAERAAAARARLTTMAQWFESYLTANRSSTAEGFGRLDAIGRIVNQVIRFTSGPQNSVEPNAPTSFPLLWDAPRHDFVQWTGFAPNADVGSLGRNAGEVIGVFGQVHVERYATPEAARRGYSSTINGHALVSMENTLYGLRSPTWPEGVLPPIDRALATRGRALYQTHCASCHAHIDREDPARRVTAMVTGVDVVGTDDTSARNLAGAWIPSGVLEGAAAWNGGTYGARERPLRLLFDLVSRSLSQQPTAALRAGAAARLHHLTEATKQGQHARNTPDNPTAELLSYKARPLNGIWAAAPYLHNGSVPTLYHLLLPAAARPVRFAVGRWEYDPRRVGYVSEGDVPFVVDTTLVGNSNRGHEYGTALDDADRWALVEYLKSL
jgi:mono/diheme cytochrome c family protein